MGPCPDEQKDAEQCQPLNCQEPEIQTHHDRQGEDGGDGNRRQSLGAQ